MKGLQLWITKRVHITENHHDCWHWFMSVGQLQHLPLNDIITSVFVAAVQLNKSLIQIKNWTVQHYRKKMCKQCGLSLGGLSLMAVWNHTFETFYALKDFKYTPDLVFALADGFKQTLFGAVERQTSWEEDEEDDSTAPHVHWLTVRLSLHHFGGHEVGSSYPT